MVLWFNFFLSFSNITHLFLCMLESHLTRFSKISFLSFASNKVFYFSQVNVFIVCHLSKICLQSERKSWFYLVQNVRFSVKKNFEYLFRKKELFLKSSCFLLFRNTCLKEHHWVAASSYFNREDSQKHKNTTLENNLKRVLISWRKYLFNGK